MRSDLRWTLKGRYSVTVTGVCEALAVGQITRGRYIQQPCDVGLLLFNRVGSRRHRKVEYNWDCISESEGDSQRGRKAQRGTRG